ncbi:MAG TPA: exo-beta-N-acetylmuramidase NamZ domain-containing protein, partial [Candidatus Acidoferrum sp.]|nr:exo-beta-N-acetylmuramidase NamZ domain-containing protein [Candidatus Acidoferrum sp.]
MPTRILAPRRVIACAAGLILLSNLSVCLVAASAATKHASHKSPSRAGRVQTGLDVLESQKFTPLRGKHIGIITNHTGLDSQGKSTIELLAHAPGVQIVAIFSPEHGLGGQLDERLSSTKDPSTGLRVFTLYGETLRPTDEMLKGVDTLVFDIQDAGVRFYTYTVTLAYAMEEAAKRHIAFYVLDRPNPL